MILYYMYMYCTHIRGRKGRIESGEISPTFTTVYSISPRARTTKYSTRVQQSDTAKKSSRRGELSLPDGDYHDWGGLPVGGGREGGLVP